ncbi:MAG: hypothetical protein AAGG02_05255 [Cyanobacteria bacterium P01_H01_bin.15]
MSKEASATGRAAEKIQLSIELEPDLVEQISHLTNEPSRIIETAIKQWLKGERNGTNDLSRTFRRNPPVPPRGEWND